MVPPEPVSPGTDRAAPSARLSAVAGDIMQPDPVTIDQRALLADAEALMQQRGFHQLPVVEDGKLVGILSKRDLQAHTGYWSRTKVDAAMTSTPLTVGPRAPVLDVAHLLIDKQINSVPVVDGDRLVGIVTRTDLLRVLVRLLENAAG